MHRLHFRVVFLTASFLLAASHNLDAFDDYRVNLLDSQKGIHIQGATISGRKVTPDCPTAWSIQQVSLHGGKQEGVELLVVDNGEIKLTMIPTRGMGLLSVEHRGVRIGWQSPVHEVVHPKFINLESRDGLGWLEGFNEWMCRCGLESNGHPGIDKFITNTGDESEMKLTLHGKIANIPASTIAVTVQREAPYAITITGRVDECMFYGPKLELHTSIVIVPGQAGFRISDTIHNRGAAEQEFELIYHTNFGRPFVGKGSHLVSPARRVRPFNQHAAKSVTTYATCQGPTPGFIEQVYLMELFADQNHQTHVMLCNAERDRAVSMKWSTQELPYLTFWKNEAAVADGYVTGVEPGTNYPSLRSVERAAGRVPKLAAGGDYHMAVEFEFHADKKSVAASQKRIVKLQGDRKTLLETEAE